MKKNKEGQEGGRSNEGGGQMETDDVVRRGGAVRRAQGTGAVPAGPDPSRCCGVSSFQNSRQTDRSQQVL